jgi:1-acyl-sn-glycerol-3-phosphate acyltransferase
MQFNRESLKRYAKGLLMLSRVAARDNIPIVRELYNPDISVDRFIDVGSGLLEGLLNYRSRVNIIGAENIPHEGSLLLVGNHAKIVDPPIDVKTVYDLTGRKIRMVMRDDYFVKPLAKKLNLNNFMRNYCYVLLWHRGDLSARAVKKYVKEITDNLQEGAGLYPAATRSRRGSPFDYVQLNKGGKGAATKDPGRLVRLILNRYGNDVKLLPRTITYDPFIPTQRFPFMFGRTTLVFGKPIDVDGSDKEAVRSKVNECINVIERSVYVHPVDVLSEILYQHAMEGEATSPSAERPMAYGALNRAMEKATKRIPLEVLLDEQYFSKGKEWSSGNDVFHNTVKWMSDQGAVLQTNKGILVNSERLGYDAPDKKFRDRNPVAYYRNRISGIPEIGHIVEDVLKRV